MKEGTSLVVQQLRLHAPIAGDMGLIPGQETRSHMLNQRPRAAKSINIIFFFFKDGRRQQSLFSFTNYGLLEEMAPSSPSHPQAVPWEGLEMAPSAFWVSEQDWENQLPKRWKRRPRDTRVAPPRPPGIPVVRALRSALPLLLTPSVIS